MNKIVILMICSTISLSLTAIPKHKTDALFGSTDRKITRQIYHMLGITDAILTKNNIPYWMIGGTLLGAARHKGMIRWDDDADLGIAHEITREQILALEHQFSRYHLHVFESLPGLIKVVAKGSKFPFVDLFLTTHDSKRKVVYITNAAFPDIWHDKDLYPLKRARFGPFHLPTPTRYMQYLFSKYGNDCMTHATYLAHKGNKMGKLKNKKVRIVNFKPAPW